jgi:DNA-binding CsgD family transcriptional regulator
VVPFDAYCMNTADPSTLEVTSSVGDGLSPQDAARLFAIEARGTDENPLSALARRGDPVAVIGARPERSERMRALFLPRGWHDELRAALVERGTCWGYLHLFRAERFSPSEIRDIRRLVKHLAGALRTAARRDVPATAPDFRPGVVTVSPGGRVSATTASGARALALLPGDPAHDGVPHAVLVVAERAVNGNGYAASIVGTPGGLLRLTASALGDEAVLTLDRPHARDETQHVLATYGLSPREAEVCFAMIRGKGDDEIAAALGIETNTAKSHARAAFAKLGVPGRGGLLAKLELTR